MKQNSKEWILTIFVISGLILLVIGIGFLIGGELAENYNEYVEATENYQNYCEDCIQKCMPEYLQINSAIGCDLNGNLLLVILNSLH